MRIEAVTPIPLALPEPNDNGATRWSLMVRLQAADGMVGWGEGVTTWPEATKAACEVVEGTADCIVGHDALDVEGLWHSLRERSWWYGRGGIASMAISAVDIAAWDLCGKLLGKSLLEMLGGARRERIAAIVSAHPAQADLARGAAEAAESVGSDLHGYKFGMGKRGDAALGRDHDRDVAWVRMLREALGPEKLLIADAGHGARWDRDTALGRARAFEPYELRWLEEPLAPADLEGHALLRQQVEIPIGTGEREWGVAGYRRLLLGGAADILGVDPGRVEGISGARPIVEVIDQLGGTFNAHAWAGALISAASLALSLHSKSAEVFELKPLPCPAQDELVCRPLTHTGGWMEPLAEPGIGLMVEEDAVAFYSA